MKDTGQAYPHGLVGYVVADDGRTRNAVLLLRWALAGIVLVVLVLAAAVVVLAAHAPSAAWLFGGLSAVASGGVALRARRRR
ncbi:hypothetical protein Lesp02_74820 [Lentzea sp. NBRC 105346]|uniref:hypothetical protein n=1 Tax=Lentzea sp. NBRC 105346 TaxID=3032205 RepID=UPI0024A3630A|nr:hypothetical protein [Lentzea sp. NBRC 105346]GLZ35295.1 hypothetical protein Lesp02_74820 [Lentzea sp. NBRC 105346]